MVLQSSGERTGQVEEQDDDSLSVRGGGGEARATDDDESSRGKGSFGGSDGSRGRAGRGLGAGQAPFILLLKKTTDLVLQPFQALQVCFLCGYAF